MDKLTNPVNDHAGAASWLNVGLAVISDDDAMLEIGRQAIEDALIEWRNERLSEPTRGNGLVIREKDGSDSSIIRFGPETALRIGLKAIAAHLTANVKLTGLPLTEGENSNEH